MAETPISSLPVANALADSDIGVFVVSGTTSRIAKSVLQAILLNGAAAATLADADTVPWLVSGVPGTVSWTVLQGLVNASVRAAGIPQNSQNADYTLVLSDAGKYIQHLFADNNPRTFTIPSNGAVAFPLGTAITFVNEINTLTIGINGGDFLVMAGTGATGSRMLGAWGIATALKVNPTLWLISGTGLS